jgi:hypothetical protein
MSDRNELMPRDELDRRIAVATPRAKRRGRGDGGLRERDGRWVAAVSYIDPESGKRERRSVSAPTRQEAKAKLKELQERLEAGTLAAGADKVTVAAWAERWLDTKRPTVRPGTFVPYTIHVRHFILPLLGGRTLV